MAVAQSKTLVVK